MAFSFYQSLRTVPRELDEAARLFGLSPWQRFWRLEVPFAHAGADLEHDDVDVGRLVLRGRVGGDHASARPTSRCPASAPTSRWRSSSATCGAVGWAIVAMLVVILLYDQLLFRPLVAWADKFRFEQTRRRRPADARGCSTCCAARG